MPETMQFRRRSLMFGVTALVAAMGSGCASLPENMPAAQLKPLSDYATEQTIAQSQSHWPTPQWWLAYQDNQLNWMMQEALQNSPDLAGALARLDEAAAYLGLSRSATRPDIGAQGSVTQQKRSYNDIIPPAMLPQGWNDYGSVTMNFQWDLDFWGKNRALLAASTSEFTARKAELAQANLILTAAVAANYAELDRLYQNLDTAEKSRNVRAKTVELFSQRHEHGLENIGIVREAEARRAVAEGRVLALREQISLKQNQLATLLGAGPDRGKAITRPTLALTARSIPPQELTLNLLGHRPDITAARLRVESQQQRVKAGKAAFYPNISLAAFIGYEALGVDQLFDNDSYTGSAGPAIYLPIFNGGRLRSQLRAENAHYSQAVASYNGAITHALQDVADVLTRQRALGEQVAKAEEAVNAASLAHDVAQNRYQGGMANYLQVLSAEDVMLASMEALINLQANALALDIQLNRALGGGYNDRNTPVAGNSHI